MSVVASPTAISSIEVQNPNGTLVASAQVPIIRFDPTPQQIQVIRTVVCPDANDDELAFFLDYCRSRNLNPILKQAHLIIRSENKQDDSGTWTKVRKPTIQTSIDGFTLIAERTGKYQGCETFHEGDFDPRPGQGSLVGHAIVHKANSHPIKVALHFWEFAQTKGKGDHIELAAMWARMPRYMIEKVALACALRRAFPDDLGGMYTFDELPIDITPQPENSVAVESRRTALPPKGTKQEVVERVQEQAKRDDAAKNQDAEGRHQQMMQRLSSADEAAEHSIEVNINLKKENYRGRKLRDIDRGALEFWRRTPAQWAKLSPVDQQNIEIFLSASSASPAASQPLAAKDDIPW